MFAPTHRPNAPIALGSRFAQIPICILITLSFWAPAAAQPYTVKAIIGSRIDIGWPMVSDGKHFVILRRDGSYKKRLVKETSSFTKISNSFEPYPIEKFQKRLNEVYGPNYEVSRSRHFVVVHPPGNEKQWAAPFEKLFVQFKTYFSSRGFDMTAPRFPLVAVIFKTRAEYDSYTARQGIKPKRNLVGYYLVQNNRIITYDQTAGTEEFGQNTRTIIHEAAHQIAFNTGVQNRFAPPPSWVGEGIAVMFEANGIRDRHRYPSWNQRLHEHHLAHFQTLAKQGKVAEILGKIIVDDQLFKSEPAAAYSVSWALTFYLAEAKSRQFSAYLQQLAKRKNFTTTSAQQRWRDFAEYFGSDLNDLQSRMRQYLAQR
jgi:hypothetical protein